MSEIEELKPCPFCGGEARTIGQHRWWVTCQECMCDIGFDGMDESGCYGRYDTEADAIRAWNTRVIIIGNEGVEKEKNNVGTEETNGCCCTLMEAMQDCGTNFLVRCDKKYIPGVCGFCTELHRCPFILSDYNNLKARVTNQRKRITELEGLYKKAKDTNKWLLSREGVSICQMEEWSEDKGYETYTAYLSCGHMFDFYDLSGHIDHPPAYCAICGAKIINLPEEKSK